MKALKVLVVDDDPDFAETIADVLESEGHTVAVAFTGEEALARVEDFDFDLAFMDVRLPGINGVESFLEIRNRKPLAKVIMMTGFSMEDLLQRALDSGAWAVLKKPLDILDILRRVDEINPEGTILIVDDDADFALSIQQILESRSYRTQISPCGREALQAVKREGTDLILLDIRLPDINGLEVFLEIRKVNSTIPVIAMTGYPDDEAEKISLINSSSNTGVIVKPIDPALLCRRVDELMGHYDSRGSKFV